MTTHDLKIEERWAIRIGDGTKTCELRKNDRDFQCGDLIHFTDTKGRLLGYIAPHVITHVLQGAEGLQDGFCVLSLQHYNNQHDRRTKR
jgi:hypothetical protein